MTRSLATCRRATAIPPIVLFPRGEKVTPNSDAAGVEEFVLLDDFYS